MRVISNKAFFHALVGRGLKEVIPQIDIKGRDRRMYEIALEDLEYYLRRKWRISNHLDFLDKFTRCIEKEGEPVRIYVFNWLRNWYSQWLKRVKLILRDTEWTSDKEQITQMIRKGSKLISISDVRQYKQPIVETLIRHGIIVCVDTIADQIVKREIAQRGVAPEVPEEKFTMLNTMLRHAKDIAGSITPLIFIRLNKEYFVG